MTLRLIFACTFLEVMNKLIQEAESCGDGKYVAKVTYLLLQSCTLKMFGQAGRGLSRGGLGLRTLSRRG